MTASEKAGRLSVVGAMVETSTEGSAIEPPGGEHFRAVMECSSDAVLISDFETASFIEMNQRACQIFGYTRQELLGMRGRQLHAPDDRALVDGLSRELINSGAAHRPALRLRRKDGSLFWAELRIRTYQARGRDLYVAFIRDASERLSREKELNEAYRALEEKESQLVLSTRLAALGQLAAGIAHEVNNPAASVQLNLGRLQDDLVRIHRSFASDARELDAATLEQLPRFLEEARENVSDCLDAIARIASTVKGLRGFARIDQDGVDWVDMNEVVQTACSLVQHQVRDIAVLETELGQLPRFVGERGKLIQVVVNLLLNASHAIEEGGGGLIRIRTRGAGDGVVVQVSDDGPGIPPDVADQIFQPFFTTKASHKGMGLGLSLSADVVRQHAGRLGLAKGPLAGACLELFVPRHTGLNPTRSTPERTSVPGPTGMRILTIDDDPAMARAYQRTLGRDNDIVTLGDGEEALARLEWDDHFDVILCDLMMPGLDGVEFHERLAEKKPELLDRLIFCSGGPTTTRAQAFVAQGAVPVLLKPVEPNTLNEWIARKRSPSADKSRPSGAKPRSPSP